MPAILGRSAHQNRRVIVPKTPAMRNGSTGGVWMTPVDFEGLPTINNSADASLHGFMGGLSISSDRSTPSIQKDHSSTSSSIRRNSSMTFDEYQNAQVLTATSHTRPPRYPTNGSTQIDDGASWGHFVDVAAADEATTQFSRVLSSTPESFSDYNR